jgi:protein HIRA/HIR1
VNAVRWSGSGRFLASGGDDQQVILWHMQARQPDGPIENWQPMKRLVGHKHDVVDLCWSPDDRFIASGSIDNTVIIWDIERKEMMRTLNGHESIVKGVAWDPLGRFLVSQGDAKSKSGEAIVWRTTDWAKEARLTEPFV